MSRKPPSLIYFDLGNVLVAFDSQLACENLARRFGVDTDRAREVIYDSGLQERFEHGQVNGEQYAEAVRRAMGRSIAVPTGEILDAVSAMFRPIESMAGIVSGVRAAGYRIGLLSNTSAAHWDWIGRQAYPSVRGGFDVVILSYEVGVMKPDARIYRAAERAAGVGPEEILFVDDRWENVAAAQSLGWWAEQCLGGPQTAAALRKHRVISDG